MNCPVLFRYASALAFVGLLASPLAADQGRMMNDLQSKLAGPDERLRLSTAPHPDGTPSFVEMVMDPETGTERQQARGLITMRIFPPGETEMPRLTLISYALDFVPERGVIEAAGDVIFRQEGIDATAQEMTYQVDEGYIEMRGEPIVNQRTGKRNARFEGMEVFVVKTLEDGGRDVEMRGPDEVHILMTPIDEELDDLIVVPAATDGTESTADSQPMVGLGDEIDIRVAPRGDLHPKVDADILPTGELGLFRGEGSVRLRTDQIDLRSDELVYDSVGQTLQATTNVYFRKGPIEADSGRLDYDLQAGRILLTVNPDVRQFDDQKVIRIWDNDWFVINLREGGGYDVSYGATTSEGQMEIMSLKDYEGTAPSEELSSLPVAPPRKPVLEVDPQRPIIRESLPVVPTTTTATTTTQ
jgi:lipopolysaccharide export system protein LptA